MGLSRSWQRRHLARAARRSCRAAPDSSCVAGDRRWDCARSARSPSSPACRTLTSWDPVSAARHSDRCGSAPGRCRHSPRGSSAPEFSVSRSLLAGLFVPLAGAVHESSVIRGGAPSTGYRLGSRAADASPSSAREACRIMDGPRSLPITDGLPGGGLRPAGSMFWVRRNHWRNLRTLPVLYEGQASRFPEVGR